ncbi:MAG: hypothetical protein HeimC3_54790 [Candidatus Heimdallarchaeota archaeon LC_3]|nr:MAG: hypothetical protein HeimC3_54790 [Candidatus Heimdallarchaeota archaeon LC_3]
MWFHLYKKNIMMTIITTNHLYNFLDSGRPMLLPISYIFLFLHIYLFTMKSALALIESIASLFGKILSKLPLALFI